MFQRQALNAKISRVVRQKNSFMVKPPISKDHGESECGCRRWYESVPGGPVDDLEEIVEYCEIHDVESGSA